MKTNHSQIESCFGRVNLLEHFEGCVVVAVNVGIVAKAHEPLVEKFLHRLAGWLGQQCREHSVARIFESQVPRQAIKQDYGHVPIMDASLNAQFVVGIQLDVASLYE